MSKPRTASLSALGRAGLALALAGSLAGCATSSNPKDPYEKFNRAMFTFNDAVDKAALKPAATAYKKVLPSFVQTGISNFFGNLHDVWSGANNLLQGKGGDGLSDLTRFALNSTLGLAGVLDIASDAGLRKHNEDFGQTLGHWGVKSGPYLMLPLLGPSTVRDTLALPIDIAADPWGYKKPVAGRNLGTIVRVVDERAAVLDASNLMEEAALDRYEFVRDGFLQRRESRIYDGEAPPKAKDDGADDKGQDGAAKPGADKPAADKPVADQPAAEKPAADKPAPAEAPPATDKPAPAPSKIDVDSTTNNETKPAVSSESTGGELTQTTVTATASGSQSGN